MLRPKRDLLILGLLAVFSGAGVLSAQDSTLGSLVPPLLRSQLVGGGYRDTIIWQASDSETFAILRDVKLHANEVLRPPASTRFQCPGGTDLRGAPLRQPVGYSIQVEVGPDSGGNLTLDVWVSCTFTYRGRPNFFAERAKWSLTRRDGRWILGPELEHVVT
jgi:hypothetical protein